MIGGTNKSIEKPRIDLCLDKQHSTLDKSEADLKKKLSKETSISSSSTNTSTTASEAGATSPPPKSPSYEALKDPPVLGAAAAVVGVAGKGLKMEYLTVRKLSDDEFSEADSMTR